jgi:putative peptidoglycan lipid II flippase
MKLPFNNMALRSRVLIRDTFTTSSWSVLGRGIGFLVPFFIAAWFGVTAQTDAFFFAYGIILIFAHILSPVVESVIVPYVAEAKSNSENVGEFVGGILKFSGLALLGIFILVLLFSKPVLSIATNFDSDSIDLLFYLLIEMSPLIILLVWTSILSGTLNAYKKFAFPAVSPAIRAVINLTLIWFLKDSLGIHSVTVGYLVGEIIRLIVLVLIIRYFKLFRILFPSGLDFRLIQFFKVSSYPVIGMIAAEIGAIVSKMLATWVGVGSVSLLYYADRLYMIPRTFVTTGLLVTLLSHWSERYYTSDRIELIKSMNKTIKIVALLSLLLTVFLVVFHKPIVRLAFGRGEFDSSDLPAVGNIWIFYLMGFVPYVLARIFILIQVIRKNTKVIMYNSIYRTVVVILFSLIFMRCLGVKGIALAMTLASYFEVFYLGKYFIKLKVD